ncbi:hypothetical protein JOM56_002948 [Amanita muscaria]
MEVPLIFNCIPDVQDTSPDRSRESQSFEEVRVLDYLRLYQLTGRPPQPCPVEPLGDVARAALGLPPHFKPWPYAPHTLPLASRATHVPGQHNPLIPAPHPQPAAVRPADPYALTMEPVMRLRPEELPRVQVFTPVTVEGQRLESIVASPTFAWYSFEELRSLAYAQGLRHIIAPIPTPPLAEETTATSSTPTLIFDEEVNGTMDHICAHPDYLLHSPEELRLAFMRSGRQLNSQQLMQ